MTFRIVTALALCTSLAVPAGDAAAQVSTLFGGGRLSVDVTTFRESKFRQTVPQQFDYSCGAASVATLLTYHFERPTTEREAFRYMWELGDQERIKREGFSLLEMKLFLESLGYEADGFRVDLSEVEQFGMPAIIIIEIRGYKHFVLIKGIRNGVAMVADPALGLKRWELEELESVMAGDVVFVIHSHEQIGKRHFNTEEQWALLPTAPLGEALNRDALASFSVLLPGFNEF